MDETKNTRPAEYMAEAEQRVDGGGIADAGLSRQVARTFAAKDRQIEVLKMDNGVYRHEVERLNRELREARAECTDLSNQVGKIQYAAMQLGIERDAKHNRILYLEDRVRGMNEEHAKTLSIKDERIRLLEELGRRRLRALNDALEVIEQIRRAAASVGWRGKLGEDKEATDNGTTASTPNIPSTWQDGDVEARVAMGRAIVGDKLERDRMEARLKPENRLGRDIW